MAIGFNAQTNLTSTTVEASWSFNHTCAGSDRLLLVFVSAMRNTDGGIGVSTCTFGGTNMTLAVTRGWNDTGRTRSYRESIYYLVNPTTTTSAVAVTVNTNSSATTIAAVSLTGVLQASPLGGNYSADISNTTNATTTVTATTANAWLVAGAMMRKGDLGFTPGTNVTELFDLSTGSDTTLDISAVGGYKVVPSAGALVINFTAGGANYGVIVAAEFKPAAAPTQEIAPAGKAVTVGISGPTVWNHRIVAAVGAGNDDARQYSDGSVSLTTASLFVHGSGPIGAYIIRDLLLPAAPTVTGAWARGYVYDANYDSPGLTIRAEAAPADFAATTNNLSGRTKTSSGVGWTASNLATGWQDSPDIRAVVQEALADGDWNGDIAIFLIDNGTGGQFDIHAFDIAGDNQPQLVIEWRFGGIAPEGRAVGVGIGGATVGRGAVSVAPAGKAVGVGKGSATVGRGTVSVAPAGRAVAVGKGSPAVGRGAVSVAPAGRAVAVGKGSATVGRGTVSVVPAGRAVAVGKGTPAVGRKIAPAGRAVGLALGAATVGRGAVSVAPAGKAVAVGKGAPTVAVGMQTIAPAGRAVAVGKGAPVVGRGAVSIAPAGKAVAVGKGTPTVARVALQIAPAGKAVAIGKGSPTVAVQGPQEIAPAGRAVGIGKGTPGVVARGIGVNAVTVAGYSESAGSWSFNHAGGGVHRLAAVIVHGMRTTAGPINLSATYGGAAMSPAVVQQYADEPRTRAYVVAIFTLANPPTGSQGVEVTSAQNLTAVVAAAVTLANVSQSAPLGGSSGGNVIGSTHCTPPALEALAGSWLLGGATMRGGDLNFTPGAGVAELYDTASGESSTADLAASAGYRPLAAAGTASWAATTNALDYGVAAMVEVRPAMVVYAGGLGVGVALGAAAVRNLADVRPAGRAVAVAIGAAAVGRTGAMIGPAGKAVGLALGGAALEVGGVVVRPAGLAAAAALGGVVVGQIVAPAGRAVAVGKGAPAVVGSATAVGPAGRAVAVGLGAARVWSHRIVAAVVEDGYETPAGAVFLSTTSLNVEAGQPWAALATGALDVPPAATIVTARIGLQTITHDDPALEAACELDASPAALATTAGNISGRTLTPARARWEARDVGLGAVQSINLGPVVQPVVNLPEWAVGSRLLFVLRDLGAGGWLRWYSADAGEALRPAVIIEWQFGAADLAVAPAGLGVAAAAGQHQVAAGGVSVAPAGRAVAVGKGTPAVVAGVVVMAVAGVAVAVGQGTPAVVGGLLVFEAAGLAVGVAAGAPVVGAALRPAGLAVAAAAGAHVVGRGGKVVAPAGRAVVVGKGSPAVGRGGLVVAPAGRAVAVGKGSPAVGRGGLVVAPAGLVVAVAKGSPAVGQAVRPAGRAVAVAKGVAVIVLVARPAGQAVAVGRGAPAVGRGAATVAPAGRAVVAAAGAHLVTRGGKGIAPAGQAVGVASGSPAVARRLEFVRPTGGLAVGAVFGAVMVALARQPWRLSLRPRGNELTLDERGNELTLAARGNELTVEER